MSVPLTIKVDLGIAECVETVNRIFERRSERKEDFLRNLSDDLDAASKMVKTLNDSFIKLARGFADLHAPSNPPMAETLIEQTDKYLTDHDLLPKLKNLKGRIAGCSMRGEVAKTPALKPLLESIDREIERFILLLGRDGVTGV